MTVAKYAHAQVVIKAKHPHYNLIIKDRIENVENNLKSFAGLN